MLAILTIVAISCSDDDDSGSSTVAGQGQINFTVDGEEKSYDGSAFYFSSDNATNITDAATGQPTISIVLNDVGPGDEITLDLNNTDDNDKVSITYSAGDSNDGTATYTNSTINSTEGQINITKYTDSEISGEFNAVLQNAFSEEISVQNGSFSNLNVEK